MSSATAPPVLERVRAATDTPDPTDVRILDAALATFVDVGLRRTTVDDIASAARVGRATIYRRFATRDGVVRAVILRELARFVGEVDAAVQPIADPRERLVEQIVATLREAREHPLLRRLTELEADLLLPFLTVQAAPALALCRASLVEELTRSQQAGAIEADLDLETVAELLVRVCQSLLLTPDGHIRPDHEQDLRDVARAHLVPLAFRPHH